MAQSPSHKFGQIIGDMLESAIYPLLAEFAKRHNFFLDKKGPRPARTGKKVAWTDLYGNTHDLDYVLEKGGTRNKLGTPVAFIESAWRRYTKHSRNKAQEIQGAICPLLVTYKRSAPFIGAILAGVFTEGALTQLRSLGFKVLYFAYDTVISAFTAVGIDARYDEKTPDAEFARKVRTWEALNNRQKKRVARKLLQINSSKVNDFINSLQVSATRQIESIVVIPLHGQTFELHSADEAIALIRALCINHVAYPQ